MRQGPPADPGSLADLPPVALGELYRVWRYELPDGRTRADPWWFSAVDAQYPESSGRFDLPAPAGTMHLSRAPVVAWLEAIQTLLANLPVEELDVRRVAHITPPEDAPPAADLTTTAISAVATQGLWADDDHLLSQQWAAAARRDGWWAVSAPSRHAAITDPHAVALFNPVAGPHQPTHGGDWSHTTDRVGDEIVDELQRRGVRIRGAGNLPPA